MKKGFINFVKFIYDFFYKMAVDRVGIYTAQAAFFIVLSFFPFFMLVLSIISVTGISQNFFLSLITNYSPTAIAPLLKQIINELFTHTTGTTISITIVIAIWSASKGVLSIMFGLYNIYKVHMDRNYFVARFISMIYTVLFVGAIVIAMVLLVFGNRIIKLGVSLIPSLDNIALVTLLLRYLMAFLLLIGFFLILYKITNREYTRFSKLLPGALFSSLGWIIFSYGFSIYVDNFNNMTYMYGSLTAFIILMLWIYFCIYILFIGCEINKRLHPEIALIEESIISYPSQHMNAKNSKKSSSRKE